MSQQTLVLRFNNKYKNSTIRIIIKDKIQKEIDGRKRGKLEGEKHSDPEEALLKWLKDVRSEKIAVDAPTLKINFRLTLDITRNFFGPLNHVI